MTEAATAKPTATLDVSNPAVEAAAVAAIRAMTPPCFQNLLSTACDALVEGSGAEDGTGMSIDPLIGSVKRAAHPDGVRFSMEGRLHAGHYRRFDVRVHGMLTPGGVEFISVERAYDTKGRNTADPFRIAA